MSAVREMALRVDEGHNVGRWVIRCYGNLWRRQLHIVRFIAAVLTRTESITSTISTMFMETSVLCAVTLSICRL